MEKETHRKANTLYESIIDQEKHINAIDDLVDKVNGASNTDQHRCSVGLFNEYVKIGKENALIILQIHKAQAVIELEKMQSEYDKL